MRDRSSEVEGYSASFRPCTAFTTFSSSWSISFSNDQTSSLTRSSLKSSTICRYSCISIWLRDATARHSSLSSFMSRCLFVFAPSSVICFMQASEFWFFDATHPKCDLNLDQDPAMSVVSPTTNFLLIISFANAKCSTVNVGLSISPQRTLVSQLFSALPEWAHSMMVIFANAGSYVGSQYAWARSR